MTIGEIHIVIKSFQKQKEEEVKENLVGAYNTAFLTATFINSSMNGKPIPQMYELFPTLFHPEEDKSDEEIKEQEFKAMMLYKEQMLDFAAAHNKRRNAVKEGESN